MQHRPRAPWLATTACVLAMLLSLLAPFWSMTDEYAEQFMRWSDTIQVETAYITLSNEDLLDISVFEYAVTDYAEGRSDWEFIVALAAFCGVGLLFSLFNRPILALISIAPAIWLFWMFTDYYTQVGALESGEAVLGWGAYLFFAAAATAIAGCIWMFISRRRWRKANKATARKEGKTCN